ncbi:HNH endonuclease [Pseudonocardia sp.]|uniref:HNH endonuclease n=1 Tax=Pseudonocardia sp. TaxID=60912 RepID=UPI003D0F58C4
MVSRQPPDQFRIEALGLDVRHEAPADASEFAADALFEIDYYAFDRCPICLENSPADREHVPPRSIGGQIRTLTCARCNNDLGSRVEDELFAWLSGSIGRVLMSSPNSAVIGSRRIPKMYYRTATNGEFILLVIGGITVDQRRMLQSREFELTVRSLDEHRWRIAALKHAYLAACLSLGQIPETESAREIRRDLVAARDAASTSKVPRSGIADSLFIGRTFQRAGDPQIPSPALCRYVDKEGGEAQVGILLATQLMVSWPLSDIPILPPNC